MQEHVTPRALATGEIEAIIGDYCNAAQCARDAGFDGVEIHAANNYLLEQFIRDSTNQRTDRYGGSLENRLRLPLEVARTVAEVWGGGGRVGIRLSPTTTMPGETPLDGNVMGTYGTLLDALAPLGLAYVHVIEGITQQTRDHPEDVDFAVLRRHVTGAYIANNNYTVELAEKAIADGHADLFSLGRLFIANPDLVDRLRTGAPPGRGAEAVLVWRRLHRLCRLAGHVWTGPPRVLSIGSGSDRLPERPAQNFRGDSLRGMSRMSLPRSPSSMSKSSSASMPTVRSPPCTSTSCSRGPAVRSMR